MRKIFLVLALLVASPSFAQVQGQPIAAGSNLHGVACRVNESQTDLADTEAEANFCAADKKGNQLIALRAGTASTTNPIILEDSAISPSSALLLGGTQRQDTLTADADTSGDGQPFKSTNLGALYTESANKLGTWSGGSVSGSAGGVPTSGATLYTNSSNKVVQIDIYNALDVPVRISADSNNTAGYYMPVNSRLTIDFGQNGRYTTGNIAARAVGSNSTSGTIYYYIMY